MLMNSNQYIIKDWADNHLFKDKVFSDYESGWEFLYQQFPVIEGDDREDELDELYVVPKEK